MEAINIQVFINTKLLSKGLYSSLYSANREADGSSVVLKLAKSSPPKKEEIAAIDHEVEIYKKLQGSSTPPCLIEAAEYKGAPVIAMEEIPHPTVAGHRKIEKKFEYRGDYL